MTGFLVTACSAMGPGSLPGRGGPAAPGEPGRERPEDSGPGSGQGQGLEVASSKTIRGSVTGSATAREKVDIRETGSLDGDIIAPRIALVDGGYFCGSVKEQSSGN